MATPTPLSRGHVTSAIPDMTVPNIRRGLAQGREAWRTSSPAAPLFICMPLIEGMTMEEFAMRFVLGQHLKRHAKSSVQRAALQHIQSTLSTDTEAAEDDAASASVVLTICPPPDAELAGRHVTHYVLTRHVP